MPSVTNKYLIFIPIIGLGIAWASIMGVPYIMAVRMIPSTRFGVYMGIINMMIVVPMLIQSLTFGWIYRELPRRQPEQRHPVRGGVPRPSPALLMLWIKEPPIVRDVDDVAHMPRPGTEEDAR